MAFSFARSSRRSAAHQKLRIISSVREAELRALESQINPHFLFNCLNSIRALVVENPVRAQDMVTRLSSVMRHSPRHNKEHTVPLAVEVEAVEDYLALEGV